MTCATCKTTSSRIYYRAGQEVCHHCGGFSEGGGTNTSNLLTRNSLRIRTQAVKNEGDFITPHIFNKATRKMEINQDFIKHYPAQTKEYYRPHEYAKAGMPKLAERHEIATAVKQELKAKMRRDVTFEGNQKDAMKKVVGK